MMNGLKAYLRAEIKSRKDKQDTHSKAFRGLKIPVERVLKSPSALTASIYDKWLQSLFKSREGILFRIYGKE